MVKSQVKFLLTICLLFCAFALTSCSDDNTEANSAFESAAFEDIAVATIQKSASAGKTGCYELVFPISIEFPDASIVEVNTYEELRALILQWKEENMDSDEIPGLVYPIEVIDEEGEILTAGNDDELIELKEACKDYNGHGSKGCGKGKERCFDLVFPVTVDFPDGTSETFEDKSSMKQAIRAFNQANETDENPSLTFPVQVEMEDGMLVMVNSEEELTALKESCQEEEVEG